ncbi:DEAD/DEAH box helicase [Lacimicrobium sp. SS2-24]|uniref:DEAD/DEAH box helicase n=1 Tax=Lacimicrobium sp. SS2-24 TaxID=2005569 RepID=UPI000B4A93BF|nr:DEAD/DEAH box helicase [Lacimicrobium sp. SS2-24]
MTTFFEKLSNRMLASEKYSILSEQLFSSYVKKMVGVEYELSVDNVRKLILIAQYLYQVDSPKFRKEGASILAMLIEVSGEKYPEVLAIANKIFSRTGDFPNVSLLKSRNPELNFRYSFMSEAEDEFRQELNSVEELNFPLTDFQRVLWNNLVSDQDVITVAPTSAGKTHIILSYLMMKMKSSDGAFAAIIVPTRALISEIANKLYEIAKEQNFDENLEICTVPKDSGYAEKTFFVMTQERLFDALQSGDLAFNFLFIDEAHNIADESRGVLLHLTIEKLLENSLPQVIVSMPSESYKDAFATLFEDVNFSKEITSVSPVAKIMMEVTPKNRDLVIERLNTKERVKVPKGFNGTHLSDIVYKLGKGSSNIIYRNQTDNCENMAQKIADKVVDYEPSAELEEAADYVEKFVHDEFSLANNLRKGVAFHYGPLPSSIRVMIENLVKDGFINFIASTSTLAEGVNLPARNLFLFKPMQSKGMGAPERLEDVKLNNITGRAGRMLEHFAGNIFIVEPDKWQVKDYFDEKEEQEEKIATYFKSLNEELPSVLEALEGNYPHDSEGQYKFYTIANKLIKEISEGRLNKTLKAPELTLDENQLLSLSNAVTRAQNGLRVAPFTLEASPTIGYIQQNKLFSFLTELDSVDEWILPHPKSNEIYESLMKVCEKLEEFGVYTPTGEYLPSYTSVIAAKWIRGDSLKSIISEQIDWMLNNPKKAKEDAEDNGVNPNKAVRDVIKVINNDIRFRMANALRCYYVLLTNVIAIKKLEKTTTKLHTYLEIGACDERMVSLINIGLSRESAAEINDVLQDGVNVEGLNQLLKYIDQGLLDGIHPVTMKEVKSMSK